MIFGFGTTITEDIFMPEQTPLNRLKYSGSLDPLIERVCDYYNLGDLIKFFVIEVGYEDCNVTIESQRGKFVAKIFSKFRTENDIIRYCSIMERVEMGGVNHPLLAKTEDDGHLFFDESTGLSLVVMKFIEGKTFFELDRAPDAEELVQIIEQAVKINSINYSPPYIFDSWAIPNIEVMFEQVREFIQSDDLELVQKVIAQWKMIPADQLPHCLVHGDFTKANVLKGDDDKIYILDFSVTNSYPRIQELAVIAANLLHDSNDKLTLTEKCQMLASKYSEYIPLTENEKRFLPIYALAGVAMEFMGAHQEKFVKGNGGEETEYWIALGREGLRKELSTK